MFISRVQKYELSKEEIQVIKAAYDIIEELYEEDFFDQEPLNHCRAQDTLDLMRKVLDNDGEQLADK